MPSLKKYPSIKELKATKPVSDIASMVKAINLHSSFEAAIKLLQEEFTAKKRLEHSNGKQSF